ncbi:MAG: hypothetical protein HC836_50650 [Richelia sp. RM2_1_2]|nr:hypothetical protein [Candidatus Methylacidiphilales bacterium]NJO66041.1 hypothetical protein [Richelia sp. RM2_1_2]
MSLYYFCRQFKQSVGVFPHQYITRQRIEKAQSLIYTRTRVFMISLLP